jgi:hypothetical protein
MMTFRLKFLLQITVLQTIFIYFKFKQTVTHSKLSEDGYRRIFFKVISFSNLPDEKSQAAGQNLELASTEFRTLTQFYYMN